MLEDLKVELLNPSEGGTEPSAGSGSGNPQGGDRSQVTKLLGENMELGARLRYQTYDPP